MRSVYKSSTDVFCLEALEERVLMSGDPVSLLVVEPPGEDGGEVSMTQEVVLETALQVEGSSLEADEASWLDLDAGSLEDLGPVEEDASSELSPTSKNPFTPLAETPAESPVLTLFEYQPEAGKALNATLKTDGEDLVLIDNSSQTEFKRQKLDTISDVILTGTPLDDLLIVRRGDTASWPDKIAFNAESQIEGGKDTLNLIGNLNTQGTYLPSTSAGSGKWNLVNVAHPQQSTLTFSGVEAVSVESLESLRYVTQGSSDRMSLTNPTSFSSLVQGTSDGGVLVPLTFTKVETFVLDLALNDKDTSSVVSVVNKLPGVTYLTGSYTHSPNDQVSIIAGANGALSAAQLKHVSILTGKGKDSMFVSGTDFSLHVSGGSFEFNGGEGADSLFAERVGDLGNVDANGQGTYGQGGSLLSLKSVELLRANPDRPVILIPDFMGSFATNSNIGNWFAQTGLHPDQLEAAPLTEDYRDMIATLENNGYRLGTSLFVANWDWRLPLAPFDASINGVISGLTSASISDEVFQFGMDYFGFTLRQSLSGWASTHAGFRPGDVDVVGFGAGGLLARAYLQSPAYGGVSSGGGVLPKIQNLSLIATPNRGQVDAWSLLHDDWSANLDVRLIGQSMNMAYERVVAGGTITTPGGAIRLENITHDGTRLGTPSTTKFLEQYLPGLRDLLPTFAFLDDGSPTLQSINGDPLLRNNFLLDLNDGLDLLYGIDQFLQGRDPNRFLEPVQGKVKVYYSDAGSTPVKSVRNLGGTGILWTFNSVIGRDPSDGEIWYKSTGQDSAGDKVVTIGSAIGQFDQDSRFGLKLTTKRITEFDAGSGAAHNKLFYNHVIRQDLLGFLGRTVRESDLSSHGNKNIVKKLVYVVQVGVSSLIQERQSGQETFGGPASISIFQKLLAGLGQLAAENLATNPEDPEGGPTTDIIDLGTASYGLIPLPLKIIAIDGTRLEFQNLQFNKATKAFTGKIGLGADSVILFPSSKDVRLTGTYITGLLEFKDNVFQSFELNIGEIRAQFKNFLSLGGRNIKVAPFADVIFSAGELFGGIPKFKLEGKVLGLQITNKAEFFVSGFEVTVQDGIFHTLQLGKFLPFDLTGLAIRFHGDANQNGFIDPGERFELTAFDLTVKGKMSQEFWTSFPFTPVVQVGPQNAASPGDELTLTLSVDNGVVTPKDIGPITLGFKDLKIGQVTLGATVTLGGYQNSVFIPDFGGFLKIESGLKDLTGAAQVNIEGDFSPDLGKLDIKGKMAVSFTIKNGLIKVDNAVLDFGMVIEKVDLAGGGFRFEVRAPQGQLFFLNKLQVGLLQVKLGHFLTFQSRNTVLDFNATGNDPLVQFGGTPQTQSPELVFDPNSVPNGSLGAVFGSAAGPIQGWGGAVGNFAIGADLSFQLLQGFFVQIKVGPNAKFGMPDFIPVELRAVTLQFNQEAIQNGELVDPGNFTLIFSGGVKETAKWPLFGQFSGLRVNVQKLVEGDLIHAIENLNGFAIGLKNVKLGPVTLSGSLALGLVNVEVTNDQGQQEIQSAFYTRLQGAVYYSGLGGGIDIVFSQYGPLLSTLSLSGLVIPKIGLVFGFRDAGFVFGGDPLPSVTDPEELLTNPVFHSPTTITLSEIEKRVQTSIIKAQPTWNSAFTLTGTGTVTSIYVQGMVSGEVTLAANIGLQGPNAGLKLLATGQLNVLGFEMGAGAMLLDFSNPLVPQFDMAFALPSPGNPIGFLFPSKGTIVASLDTKGIIEMPLVGMGVFFQKFAEGSLQTAQALLEQVLAEIASDLEEDHGLRLSRILLDLNGDDAISESEDAQIITVDFISQRILGTDANGTGGLLVSSFDALLSLTPEQLTNRLIQGEALLQELIPVLIFNLRDVANASVLDVVGDLGTIIQEAAIAGLAAGWKAFDPTFSLTGLIQPVLFGIPLGTPSVEVTIVINKDQLTFGFTGSLASALLTGNNLPPALFGDATQFAVSLDLPDELIGGLITNLVNNGAGDLQSLTDFLLDSINPFSGWEILFSTTFNFLGFKTDTYSGIVFGPQAKNGKGEFEPKGVFGKYVVNLDPDGDGKPNQDLVDEVANGLPNRIPVNTLEQYENMMANGGIALTGQLFMPDMIRNPLETIRNINWTLPPVSFDPAHPFSNVTSLGDDVAAISKYITDIVEGLTSQSEWSKLQVYLPSPANLFHIGDYLDPLTQGVIQPIDLSTLSEDKLAEIQKLIATAFIEGYSKPELLGIELSNTFIKGSVDQLTLKTEIPWLAGFESEFAVQRKSLRPQELVYHLVSSPLAEAGLSVIGIEDAGAAFAFLNHAALNDLPLIDIPVAFLEGSFTTDKLGDWLSDSFGLPGEWIQAAGEFASHDVTFAAYSPGFGNAGDSPIKRYGGFVLDAELGIAGMVDQASFHFEILPFSFASDTNLTTFFIPRFHARAEVASLTMPGLPSDPALVDIQDAVLDIERNSDMLSLNVQGHMSLLGDGAVIDLHGGFQIVPEGMFGELMLTADGGSDLAFNHASVRFDGETLLRVNTTDQEQLGIAAGTAHFVSSGRLVTQVSGVDAFGLDGQFEWRGTNQGFEIHADAKLDAGALGQFGVVGELNLHASGLFGGLQIGPVDLDLPLAQLSGEFQLVINTTSQSQWVDAFQINTTTGQVSELVEMKVAPLTVRLDMGGSLTYAGFHSSGYFRFHWSPQGLLIETDAQLQMVVGGATILGFRQRGGMRLDADGLAGAMDLEWLEDHTSDYGFSLTGAENQALSFQLLLNSTSEAVELGGLNIPSGPFVRLAAHGALETGGLQLAGEFVFEAGDLGFQVHVDASLNLNLQDQPLLVFHVDGGLALDAQGVSGVIGLNWAFSPPDIPGVNIPLDASNVFRLEVNHSTVSRQIGSHHLPAGPIARVVYEGQLQVLGLELGGHFVWQEGSSETTTPSDILAPTVLGDPGAGIIQYRHQGPGTHLYFQVTGDATFGSIWGTDVYTDDSTLSLAAVHAGVLAHGESGVVQVTLVEGESQYDSSQQNGVTSQSFGAWAGSYTVQAYDMGIHDPVVTRESFIRVEADAGLKLSVQDVPLFGFDVQGGFLLRSGKEVGHVGVAALLGLDLMVDAHTAFEWPIQIDETTFQLSINTLAEEVSFGEQILAAGPYAKVLASGSANLAGLQFAGDFSFEANQELLEIGLLGSLSLGLADTEVLKFGVDGALRLNSDGLAGLVDLSLLSDAAFTGLGARFNANSDQHFLLELNLSQVDQSFATSILPAGPYARVVYEGGLFLSGLGLDGRFLFEAGTVQTNKTPDLSTLTLPDPGAGIVNYRGMGAGSVLYFNVTGDAQTGGLWGTDVYTDDSQLSKVVVHAGVLANGETGIVRVTLREGQSSYAGSSRSGVTSSGFGAWGGSYSVERVVSGSLGNLVDYRHVAVGTDVYVVVTGDADAGSIWGTNLYTDDSNLSAAVVHAGVLADGESGLVKVRLVDGQNQYVSSQKNGVASQSYGSWLRSFSVEAGIPSTGSQEIIRVETQAHLQLNAGDFTVMRFGLDGSFQLIQQPAIGLGMVGYLELETVADLSSQLGLDLVSTGNKFRLEINTTPTTQKVGLQRVDAGPFARVTFEGSSTVGGLLWEGDFAFEVREGWLRLGVHASLSLLEESWQFTGWIGLTSDGIAVSGQLSGAGVSNAFVSIRGGFVFEMNATQSELLGISANTLRISVQNGTFSLLGIRLTGSAYLNISGNEFTVQVPERDPLKLTLLGNTINVSVSGHIRSGDIALNGSTSVSFGSKSSIHVGGTLSVTIDHNGLQGNLNLGLTIWDTYLTSTQIAISLADTHLSFTVQSSFNLYSFARFEGSVLVRMENGYLSGSLNGALRLWNTFNISVAGSVASNGQFSFSGSSWTSLGDSWVGANFTFKATMNNQGVYLSANGSAWALGITAGLSATVGTDGRFRAGLTFAGITFYVNFSLNNGLKIWLSEVGGSEIYFTSHLDGSPDGLGAVTTANAGGQLDFTADWEALEVDEQEYLFYQILDKNGDGRLDSDAGVIKILGGEHWETGETHEEIEIAADRLLNSDSDWAQATVFIDFDGDDQPDEGEPSVMADAYGFYDFWSILYPGDPSGGTFGLGLLEPFDVDGNGVIDANEGALTLIGGTDYYTDEDNPDVLVFEEVAVLYETNWVDAFVFLDLNGNAQWEEEEVGVYTDAFGFWDFDPFEDEFESDPEWDLLDLIRYDLNEDGVISEDEGVLILRSGTQIESGLSNQDTIVLEETLGYGWADFAQAEIFFDANLNGEHDADEPLVLSDEDGYFEFFTYSREELLLDLLPYDLDGNGQIDAEEGVLVLSGGFALDSGEANADTLVLSDRVGFGETPYRDARVFLDLNGNRLWEENEVSAMTDNTGFFWFYRPTTEEASEWLGDLTQFDLNGDGLLSLNEGALTLQGGTHLETGISNTSTFVIEDPYGFDFTDFADATVFFDLNQNKTVDAGELSVKTNEEGYYAFLSYSDEELQALLGSLTPFDLNRDGTLTSDEGQMVVVGGKHLLTGQVNTGSIVMDELVISGFTLYQGATRIFFDANRDLVLDGNEISVEPDAGNYFSFHSFDNAQFGLSNLGNLGRYDENHNGRLDPWEGIFVIQGGVDQHTGLENPLFVRALGSDFGSGVESSISPLSNIKVSMVNGWNIAPRESDRLITAAFGLPSFLAMNNVNPLANPNDPFNEEILAAGAMVSSMMLDMAAALQAANPSLTPIQAQSAVSDSIADAILIRVLDRLEAADALSDLNQDDDGFYHGLVDALYPPDSEISLAVLLGQRVEDPLIQFDDVETLGEVLGDAAFWTDSELSAELVQTLSYVLSEKISKIRELTQWKLVDPVLYFAPFKAVTQIMSVPSITQLVQTGQGAAELTQALSGDGLLQSLAGHSPANTIPLLSLLPDQDVLPGDLVRIPFTIWDVDRVTEDLNISLKSSNGAMLPVNALSIQGEGIYRMLEFQMSDSVHEGETLITLEVSDGHFQVTRSLQVLLLPHVLSWQSIVQHGTDGQEFALELTSDGRFTESRISGVQMLQIQFSEPIHPASALTGSLTLGADLLNDEAESSNWDALKVLPIWAEDHRSVRLVFQTPLNETGTYHISWSGLEAFNGKPLLEGTNRVFHVMPGDVNGDRRVNNLDLGAVRSLGYVYPGEMDLPHEIGSDFNADGKVDLLDEQYIIDHRGTFASHLNAPQLLYHVPLMDAPFTGSPLGVFDIVFSDLSSGAVSLGQDTRYLPSMVGFFAGLNGWDAIRKPWQDQWDAFKFNRWRREL